MIFQQLPLSCSSFVHYFSAPGRFYKSLLFGFERAIIKGFPDLAFRTLLLRFCSSPPTYSPGPGLYVRIQFIRAKIRLLIIVQDMSSIITLESDFLAFYEMTFKFKMAAAAILDSGFHRVVTLDTEIFHRSMACRISKILVLTQLSDWKG